MSTSKFQIIVISSESNVSNEIESVHTLFEGGLELFHLRKPEWSDVEYDNWIAKILPKFRSRITVHGRLDIAEKWGLGGVHLKSDDFSGVRTDKRLSKSFHNLNGIIEIKEDEFDYVTFSPVFESITKENYHPNYTLTEMKKYLNSKSTKVFALGGVRRENLMELKGMGFEGAALLGDYWRLNEPGDRVTYFNECKLSVE